MITFNGALIRRQIVQLVQLNIRPSSMTKTNYLNISVRKHTIQAIRELLKMTAYFHTNEITFELNCCAVRLIRLFQSCCIRRLLPSRETHTHTRSRSRLSRADNFSGHPGGSRSRASAGPHHANRWQSARVRTFL